MGDLAELLEPEWRVQWWTNLELTQPEVAARLVRMYPERYPIPNTPTLVKGV